MTRRTPSLTNDLANRVLIPLLRSEAGTRLGRRLAVVEYVGQRSGQPHRLVTQYDVDGTTVCIRVGRARSKTWWRNFETPHPARLRLAGTTTDVVAHVVRNGDQLSVVAELSPSIAGGTP